MDGMEGLQLLPGTKKRLGIKVPGENRFLYIGSATLGAVIVVMFWLNFQVKSREDELKLFNDRLTALDQGRDKQAEQNIRLVSHQLALTSELIDKHVYLSQAIAKLESLTQEKVRVEDLSITSEGIIRVTASAPNYTTIARQIAAFLADDSVINFSLGEMKNDNEGSIKFGMDMSLDRVKVLQKK